MLEKYVRAAALVRVYSQPLADRVAALNRRVVQSFAPVDLALVPPPCETRAPGPIKIVYTTSRTQDALCEMFMPAWHVFSIDMGAASRRISGAAVRHGLLGWRMSGITV